MSLMLQALSADRPHFHNSLLSSSQRISDPESDTGLDDGAIGLNDPSLTRSQ